MAAMAIRMGIHMDMLTKPDTLTMMLFAGLMVIMFMLMVTDLVGQRDRGDMVIVIGMALRGFGITNVAIHRI